MRLKSLRLTGFRNIETSQVDLAEGINFFVGANGQGKTNLLEAVYLLSRGVSFRPASRESLIRKRASAGSEATALVPSPLDLGRCKISATVAGEHFEQKIALEIDAAKRTPTLNGKRASAGDSLSALPVVLFSPESLAAIKEGPEQRRHLVDDLLLAEAPTQARLLREHGRCLRARNRLLRDLAQGDGDLRQTEATLESLDRIYLLLCTHLTEARIRVLRAIQGDLQQAMSLVSEGDPGDISVDYLISDAQALRWDESQIFDAIHRRLHELAAQERRAGVSLVGPHKHDVRFLFRQNDSRFYCSQGQQRALILSFKIAQIVYHHRVHQTYPVLLLDDVMSELDAEKRVGLMRFLDGISAQILMTSTDLIWPELDRAGRCEPERGKPRNAAFVVRRGHVLPFGDEGAEGAAESPADGATADGATEEGVALDAEMRAPVRAADRMTEHD